MSGCELLGRLASDIGGAAVQAAQTMHEPIRIQVAGRAGVGRSAVAALLRRSAVGAVTEAPAVDTPGTADPPLDGDVVVYVLAGAPRTPDVAAMRGGPRGVTVGLLNKADLQPSYAAALRIAAECAAETGVSTLPLVSVGAAPEIPSGRDDAVAAVTAAARIAEARRARAALKTLTEAAARGSDRDVLEGYLRSDEALRLAVIAATALDGASAADRRRRELVHRRWAARSGTEAR